MAEIKCSIGDWDIDKEGHRHSEMLFPALTTYLECVLCPVWLLPIQNPPLLGSKLVAPQHFISMLCVASPQHNALCCIKTSDRCSPPSWVHHIFHSPLEWEAISPLSAFYKIKSHFKNIWPWYSRICPDFNMLLTLHTNTISCISLLQHARKNNFVSMSNKIAPSIKFLLYTSDWSSFLLK